MLHIVGRYISRVNTAGKISCKLSENLWYTYRRYIRRYVLVLLSIMHMAQLHANVYRLTSETNEHLFQWTIFTYLTLHRIAVVNR